MKALIALLFLIPALAFGQPYYQGANVTNATGLLRPANGGTGVANNNAATLTRSGSHALTITTTGTTGVTLPTSGTLATVAGTLPITGGTLTGNLLFTDATYDIGASGATRPRDFYLSRNAVIGGTLGVTGDTSIGTGGVSAEVISNGLLINGTQPGIVLKANSAGAGEWEIYATSGADGSINFYERQNNQVLFKIDEGGTVTIPAIPSSSGVRYLCINTTGVVSSQAAACSGT